MATKIQAICVTILMVTGLLALSPVHSAELGVSNSGAIEYYRNLAASMDDLEETLKHFDVPSTQYRLNLTVTPIHYNLRMRPVLDDGFPNLEKFTVPSSVLIRVDSISASNVIVMHQRGITIHEDQVKVTRLGNGQDMRILSQTYQPDKDFYIIELEQPFQLGEQLEIFIPFVTNLSQTDNTGIYLGYYTDPRTNQTKYLSATKLEPYHARKVFPLFDEPSLKARFQVSVARLDGKYHSLSNMGIINTEPEAEVEGWVWDHYEDSVLMSPYLVCVIVSDFASSSLEIPEKNRTVAAWAPQHDIEKDGGVWGAQAGSALLEYYESLYKMPYALGKLDAVALPQFASGAMENFGLVTYRYNYLVWIPGEGTEAERRKVTQVLAHEIVHQWYGNIVTCAWWSEIWLNEGFARYFQFWGMNATIPEFNVMEAFVNDATQLAMVFDQGPLTHPVKNSAESPEESSSVFDRISYEKAASLLNMMEGFLTRPVFLTGIVDVYLQKMKWKSAYQDDLFESVQEGVEMHSATHLLPPGTTVKDVMSEWTLTPGFPLVRVDVNSPNSVFISQERFMTNSKKPVQHQADGFWWIPIKLVTAANPVLSNKLPDLWLPNNVSSVVYNGNDVDTSKWLMINPEATGYYRVLYDTKLTDLIRQQLQSDHTLFSSISRSQLFDDYFHLAFAEYIPIEITLELTRYLARESASNVWTAVLTHLKPVFNRFTQTSAALNALKSYFVPRLQGALNTIGARQVEGEKGINVTLRAQLLDMACQLDMPECVTYSKELMSAWKANPQTNPFPVDVQSSLYCAAIASSEDSSDWEFLLQKLHETTNEAQKTLLLNALACSRNATILSSLLDQSLTSLQGHTSAIFTRVAMNPVARSLIFQFATENLLSGLVTPQIFATTVSTLSDYWNLPTDILELQLFMDANVGLLEPIRASLESSLRNIQICIDWWRTFGTKMHAWFSTQ